MTTESPTAAQHLRLEVFRLVSHYHYQRNSQPIDLAKDVLLLAEVIETGQIPEQK